MFILLLVCFCLFYYLTRFVWVKIIKDEQFKVEIHLPIFAVHLVKKDDQGDDTDKKDNPMFFGYIRIITGAVSRLKQAIIEIDKIKLPINNKDFEKASILKPMRQSAYVYAFVAYMRTKAKKLILSDNAITLSPDVNALQCYVTVKLRLYQLIYALISIMHSIYEEKSKRRKKCQRIR